MAPVCCWICDTRASRSGAVEPLKWIWAPYAAVAAILEGVEIEGMIM